MAMLVPRASVTWGPTKSLHRHRQYENRPGTKAASLPFRSPTPLARTSIHLHPPPSTSIQLTGLHPPRSPICSSPIQAAPGDELLTHELTHVAQGQRGKLMRAAAKGLGGQAPVRDRGSSVPPVPRRHPSAGQLGEQAGAQRTSTSR